MRFHPDIDAEDHARVLLALESIKKHGDLLHRENAKFFEASDALLFIGPATEVGGSGSVGIYDPESVNRAIKKGKITPHRAAEFVRMNLARETIDTGGQRGIEGTFVHEGKHLRDFALMIATFSRRDERRFFNPSAFQLEYSAHLASGFYARRRGGEFADEGIALGLLEPHGSGLALSSQGIRERLRNNYGLTPETPGPLLSERWYPQITSPPEKVWNLIRKISGYR